MQYIFDVEDATKYGLDESIILYNMKFWITKNKANGTHFYDEHTWTYNSVTAFKLLFPFWTEKQITRILKSLINKGVLITGNYNKIAYDRTLWYAFKDESILPNGQMEMTKRENQSDQTVQPIPDINTDNKPNKKAKIKSRELSASFNDSFNTFWKNYDYKKDRIKCMDLWSKLDEDIHKVINKYIIDYVKSTPDKKWRMSPANFLKNEGWENEIVYRKSVITETQYSEDF